MALEQWGIVLVFAGFIVMIPFVGRAVETGRPPPGWVVALAGVVETAGWVLLVWHWLSR